MANAGFSLIVLFPIALLCLTHGAPVSQDQEGSNNQGLTNVKFRFNWPEVPKAKNAKGPEDAKGSANNNNQRGLFGKGSAVLGGAGYALEQLSSFLPVQMASSALNFAGFTLGSVDTLADNLTPYMPWINLMQLFG